MTYHTFVESPVGPLLLLSNGQALTGLYMNYLQVPEGSVADETAAPLPLVKAQLAEYFAGARTEFDLPLSPTGTAFQLRIWKLLGEIPYGVTISYGELARRAQDPNASRAVGLANGKNPISIIIPCHRVIGANGKLTGYGGGLPNKKILLDLEAGRDSLF